MRAIILAAGRGSRMGGLTEDRPKCLVDLGGRPLLDWQVAALRAAGCTEVAAVAGYRAEALEGRGLTLFRNPRWAETNMVASLHRAAAWLAAGPCIVSYADIFYAAATVRRLMQAAADIAISYDPDWQALWSARFADPLSDAESFLLRPDGTVADIGRRPGSLAEVQGQYMGLLRIAPAGWARIAAHGAASGPAALDRLDMTSLLRALIAAGEAVQALPCEGAWGEVDSASDLAFYAARLAPAG
ncbi:phosphocholine cytidylyltransferase family protein [Paracraurococcus ruber]|uniref:Nucleotidyl transferase n=1 Tax=Paracraurococcus ruber TaxID=77675 RepID=A0ABS1CVQ1_9PROT|nr:phosphocholine cytidylyltransferase family protein [Paracraurococcus ruber]MBK1658598.1 nucleotidyl transferase [Paracraurococcus ruber]TDG28502.1 phosphocholine cytidylyltransferase family protein [Paracraurococcus ruber]